MESPDTKELRSALDALSTYGPGSSRGALLAIEAAVRAALGDLEACGRLEQSLLTSMDAASVLGRIFLMTQLALVGGHRTARHLAPLLRSGELADAARRALEVLPPKAASEVIREELPGLSGRQRLGALQSLGRLRDPASVRVLARELEHGMPATVPAALGALARIGTARAGRVLLGWVQREESRLTGVARDSLLECAERLEAEGAAELAGRLRGVAR